MKITVDNYKTVDKIKINDTIAFGKLNYKVCINYLENKKSGDNSEIFTFLGLPTYEKRHKFCSKFYGYEAYEGCFPECNDHDMEALRRVMVALFDRMIELKLIEPSVPDTSITPKTGFKPKIVL